MKMKTGSTEVFRGKIFKVVGKDNTSFILDGQNGVLTLSKFNLKKEPEDYELRVGDFVEGVYELARNGGLFVTAIHFKGGE